MNSLSSSIERIPYICKLIYEAYRVPVFLLDAAGHVQLGLPESFECRTSLQGNRGLLAEAADYAFSRQAANPAGTAPSRVSTRAAFWSNLFCSRFPQRRPGLPGLLSSGRFCPLRLPEIVQPA